MLLIFVGAADLNDERLKKVTPNTYFKHLLLHKSQRFAKDPRFRYFACNSLMRWQALQKGRICVKKNSDIANMNAVALRQSLIDNPALYRKVLCYNSNLCSTKSYWFARSKELQDMVEQLGAPTLFLRFLLLTFNGLNCTDYLNLIEILEVLSMNNAKIEEEQNYLAIIHL